MKAEAGSGVMGSAMSRSRSSSEEGLEGEVDGEEEESKARFLSLVGYVNMAVVVVS